MSCEGVLRAGSTLTIAVAVACSTPTPPEAEPGAIDVATAAATVPLVSDDQGRVLVCLPLSWQEGYYWILRVPPRWVDFYLRAGGHLPEEGWYVDADGDGFGAGAEVIACSLGDQLVPNRDDCNDFLSGVSPGAGERCDGLDDDCDSGVDEGCEGVPDGGAEPAGTCLCGWPELECTVAGEPGPTCANASDCEAWCGSAGGGVPTCAPGPGTLPPECAGVADCFFIDEECAAR